MRAFSRIAGAMVAGLSMTLLSGCVCFCDDDSFVEDGFDGMTYADNTIPIGNDTEEKIEYVGVCGPDITDKVFAVLEKMREAYLKLKKDDPERAKAACAALVTPDPIEGTHEVAWDIAELSPAVAPKKEDSADWRAGRHYWFEPYAEKCATPREPCGHSVVFLGRCIHPQVVNYIMWGVTNKLCDQMRAASVVHHARAKLNTGLSVARDTVFIDQQIMTELGAKFVDGRADGKSIADLKTDLEIEAVDLDVQSERAESRCAMTCEMSEREQKRWGFVEFGYTWEKLRSVGERVKTRTGM